MQNQPPTSDPDSDTVSPIDFEKTLAKFADAPAVSEESLADMENAERLRRQRKRLDKLNDQAGAKRAESRFGNFDAPTPAKQKVKKAVTDWATGYADSPSSGLILYGPVGTGKDHLAYAAVRRVLIECEANVRWVNGRDLFGMVRDNIDATSDERSFFRSFSSPDVLVISDPLPPIGDLTSHQADCLYRICEARDANGKALVITVNVGSDEEADKRLGPATWDRMCHGAWKVACRWASYRKPAREV